MAQYRPATLDDFDVMRRFRDEQRRKIADGARPTGSNVYSTTEKLQDLDIGTLPQRVSDLETNKQDKLTAGSNIQINSSNVISATDTTYSAGTNVQISSGNVISATDTTYTAGTNVQITGTTISATDTTYSAATQSADGLMSSSDKTKLDGIESGAEVNDVTSVNGQTGAVVIGNATQSTAGLMSAADKTALDNMSGGGLPVGAMVIMKTNSAPGIGGTWSLVTGFKLPMTGSSTVFYLFERTA